MDSEDMEPDGEVMETTVAGEVTEVMEDIVDIMLMNNWKNNNSSLLKKLKSHHQNVRNVRRLNVRNRRRMNVRM